MPVNDFEDLVKRVNEFQIDQGTSQSTFAKRLAQENRWSPKYAERVIREYKRFAVLSVVAGHAVTPSEQVDQAWHLHLIYSRSYWNHFCRDVLQTELHHEPSAGGVKEFARHYSQYLQTLDSYQKFFGESPPADIWPQPDLQYPAKKRLKWFPRLCHWTQSGLQQIQPMAWTSLAVLLFAIGCHDHQAPLNPFQFNGELFLVFYLIVLLLAVFFVFYARHFLAENYAKISTNELMADPYLASALANGPGGVIMAALARLVQNGHLVVTTQSSPGTFFARKPTVVITRGLPLRDKQHPVEEVIYYAADSKGLLTLSGIATASLPAAIAECERLRESGLSDPQTEGLLPRQLPLTILGFVLSLGVLRVLQGMFNNQPIGYLAFLIVIGLVIFMANFPRRKRTPAGSQLRKELLKKAQHLKNPSSSEKLSNTESALAFGLFGTALPMMSIAEMQALQTAIKHDSMFHKNTSVSGHSAGCSSGGSSCGSSDGGGGGGCGGCSGD